MIVSPRHLSFRLCINHSTYRCVVLSFTPIPLSLPLSVSSVSVLSVLHAISSLILIISLHLFYDFSPKPSRSLVISERSFGLGGLTRFSSLSEPHLINWAPHCPSQQPGSYQLEWCNVLGKAKAVITRKKKCGWGVLCSRNLVLRSLIFSEGEEGDWRFVTGSIR